MSEPFILDLDQYRSPGVRVFSGRGRGKAVKEEAVLISLEREHDKILVLVPEDTFSISSSFFLGLFGDSIRRLGENGFRSKYTFVGPDLTGVIEDSLRAALR